jgi:hypothetical protein
MFFSKHHGSNLGELKAQKAGFSSRELQTHLPTGKTTRKPAPSDPK